MKRLVECQAKEIRTYAARGPTPVGGDLAPDIEKTDVLMLFYDVEDSAHRNSYQIELTPAEAQNYEVGKIYTLTIE